MKILIIILMLGMLAITSWAQQVPTINNPNNGGINNGDYWSRAGNTNTGGTNNVFGTRWSSPIYFITGGLTTQTYRMKLNGPFTGNVDQYSINSYGWTQGVNTTGYLLLGNNTGGGHYTNKGAFSLLHLNGEGSVVQEFGYRPWMRTGVTFTSNYDLAYVGHRKLSTNPAEEDITEMTIAWSDNSTVDDLVFRFTSGGGSTTVSNDFQSRSDLDGYHVARFTGDGLFGLGNTFGVNATGMTPSPAYVRPQSLFHMSLDGIRSVWSQYTNQSGTGQAASDGLRIGIGGTGVGYVYNQENTHLLFGTGISTETQLSRERMRLTHIGAPGIPATAASGLTRVAVSLNPARPLTDPRSLLHIGSGLSGSPFGTDGVRAWMNVGLLATDSSDNIYVGLKREGESDRMDAVIAWGDNQSGLDGDGPDNLRFVFAATQNPLVPSTPSAASADGQEVARFTPSGQLGIGNFAPTAGNPSSANPNGPGTAGYVGATLDVDGDARIRRVTRDDGLSQILVRDPLDSGRVRWRDASTLGGGFGGECGTPAADASALTAHREQPLGAFNVLFSGQHASHARIGVGLPDTACVPSAKLDVLQGLGMNETAVSGVNTAPIQPPSGGDFDMGIGVRGISITGDHASCEAVSVGGLFYSGSSSTNAGVLGMASGDNGQGCLTLNYGGYFSAVNGSQSGNVGVYAEADTDSVPDLSGNWAAWINGDGYHSALWTASDAQLKRDVVSLGGASASASLMGLNPVSYSFDHAVSPGLNLPHGRQYGLLAQELEQVFPEMVRHTRVPRRIGAQGSVQGSGPSEIAVVNYTALVPVLIAAFQEQAVRIARLEAQLGECCGRPKTAAAEGADPSVGAAVYTRLEGGGEPSLGQNIPNPFETSTRIPVYLPAGVGKAEVVFYGNDGRVLRVLPVAERGAVSVGVDAGTLAAGVYSYTLFVDGRPVDTKRMVKQ